MRAILIVACTLLLTLSLGIAPNVYDEGVALVNAARVAHGDMPHEDFWSIYPGGQSYVLAGWFLLVGDSVLAARVYDVLVRLLIVVAVYRLGRRLTGRGAALAIAAMVAWWLALIGAFGYALFPAFAVALIGLLVATPPADERTAGRGRPFAGGFCIGVAAMFRLDVAAYAALAATVALLRERSRDAVRRALRLGAGIAAGAAPFYAVLGSRAGFDTLWHDLVALQATTMRELRTQPFPPLAPDLWPPSAGALVALAQWLLFFVLPLVLLAGVVVIAAHWRAVEAPDETARTATLVAVATLGAVFLHHAAARFDFLHALPAAMLAALTAAALVPRHVPRSLRRAWIALPLAVVTILPLAMLPALAIPALPSLFQHHADVPRAEGIQLTWDQERACEALRRLTREDEPIFVGNFRHDVIAISDASLYYLADRSPGTRFHHLHRGVATTREVQQRIADDLRANDVRWVVLFGGDVLEANRSAVSSGVHLLDVTLRHDYQLVESHGRYRILERRW